MATEKNSPRPPSSSLAEALALDEYAFLFPTPSVQARYATMRFHIQRWQHQRNDGDAIIANALAWSLGFASVPPEADATEPHDTLHFLPDISQV